MALTLPNTFLQRRLSPPPARLPSASFKKPSAIVCRKKDIHPQFNEDAKVYCNGELVLTTAGTQKEYVVDVWSGNHPFYLGSRTRTMIDDDQVSKFRKKYGDFARIMHIPTLKGEYVPEPRQKSGKKKK